MVVKSEGRLVFSSAGQLDRCHVVCIQVWNNDTWNEVDVRFSCFSVDADKTEHRTLKRVNSTHRSGLWIRFCIRFVLHIRVLFKMGATDVSSKAVYVNISLLEIFIV